MKADWKKCDFSWCLNVESLSIERICRGKEFQVDGSETEKEREEKWLVTAVGIDTVVHLETVSLPACECRVSQRNQRSQYKTHDWHIGSMLPSDAQSHRNLMTTCCQPRRTYNIKTTSYSSVITSLAHNAHYSLLSRFQIHRHITSDVLILDESLKDKQSVCDAILCQFCPTMSVKALCIRPVRPSCSSVRPSIGSFIHSFVHSFIQSWQILSWTAWTISIKRTANIH